MSRKELLRIIKEHGDDAGSFVKLSPYATSSLALEGMRNLIAPTIFMVLCTIAVKNITIVSQVDLCRMLHVNHRRVHAALVSLRKHNYILASKIHSGKVNTYLINTNIIWRFSDSEYKNKVSKEAHFENCYDIAAKDNPRLYHKMMHFRRKNWQIIREYHVTVPLVLKHRIGTSGQVLSILSDNARHAISNARSVATNYAFAVGALHLPRLKRLVAKYLLSLMPSSTYSIHANNASLYRRMKHDRINIGYVTVSKTLTVLKNQGLIDRSKMGVIRLSDKLIQNSYHSAYKHNELMAEATKQQIMRHMSNNRKEADSHGKN